MCRRKTIEDVQVNGKRVLVRVDFRVPHPEADDVGDEWKLQAALPTLHRLLDRGAAVVLLTEWPPASSPRDRVTTEVPRRLEVVAAWLQNRFRASRVSSLEEVVGARVEREVERLGPGELLLLGNLAREPGEAGADPALAAQLRPLAEVLVNEALSACHRETASLCLLPELFPASCRAVGLRLDAELRAIDRILRSPRRPLIALLGGEASPDRLRMLGELRHHAERSLIGGQLALVLLEATGVSIGASRFPLEQQQFAARLVEHHPRRFILPTDHVIAHDPAADNGEVTREGDIQPPWQALDLGPLTTQSFCRGLARAGTILWSGLPGRFVAGRASGATQTIAAALARSTASSLVSGDDTIAAIRQLGLADRLTHLSTAGDALLPYALGDTLPGLAAFEAARVDRSSS